MTKVRVHRMVSLLANPFVLGGLLAVLALNLSTGRPADSTDSSFRVGVTEAVLARMQFGVDVIWPYGPLGFLGGPTIISRSLLAVAIVYQIAALTILFGVLIIHFVRLGLRRLWAVLVLVPVAVALGITYNVIAEVVSLAVVVVLFVLWQHDAPALPRPTAWWVLSLAGFVSGAQILVKYGPGGLACVVVVIVAASEGRRARQVLIAIAAIASGFLVMWLAMGQSVGDLGAFFRTAADVSSGYQDAQAAGPSGPKLTIIGLLALAAVGVGALGALRWARRDRRALWVVVPWLLSAWFLLKQGLVRWDDFHAVGGLLTVVLLVAALPWERSWRVVPAGVLVAGAVASIAMAPSALRGSVSDRLDVALAAVSGDQRDEQIAESKEALRTSYDVPAGVVAALRDATVHAEPEEINAIWANDLAWNPLPTMQNYAAYTEDLDRANADRYGDERGPDGVLFRRGSVDNRYDLWESPDARFALTCNFAVVAGEADGWMALRRASDVCGPARELSTAQVAPGETVDVPEPSSRDAIVVARIDLPSDPFGRVVTAVARPLRSAEVTIDGTSRRFVTGTAGSAHIVRSPGRIGDRRLPHGEVQHETLSFGNVGSGEVTVRFEEIPLRDA